MRHRLIPVEERRAMHREYYSRAVIVSIWAIAAGVALGALALIPADIRSRSADNDALLAITAAKSNNTSDLTQAEADLGKANTLLAALGTEDVQTRFSKVIRDIVKIHSPVQLSSFNIARQGDKTITVTLQGVAPTRNDLLSFKSRLETLYPGAPVDLPISILAKNVNVTFTLRVTQQIK